VTEVARPTRGSYVPSGWRLDELLDDPQAVGSALEELHARASRFAARRPALEGLRDPAVLLDVVRDYEALLAEASKLGAYGSLWFAADTRSEAALGFRNRAQQALTAIHNRTLFFSLWWKALSEEAAQALLPPAGDAALADYRFFLEDLRRFRPFTLDERSEQIINLKDADGIDALLTLYSMLTNRLEFTLELPGEEARVLTRDRLMSYAYSPRAAEREAAYRELFRVYDQQATILAQVYVHRVRDWYNENVELRGYQSPLQVRNTANDIPDEAVETLLEVAGRNAPLFQRYFRLKAGWLETDVLRRYDIYAPLGGSDQTVDYDEAVDLVLETFGGFDERFGASARRVFEEGHIDSEPRPGKKGGAFCATVLPTMTPWVLVNYSGRLRDVATLAHELGHAVHSMLAEDHSLLTQQPSLPLAETASVFGEMLLTERLLESAESPLAQRELLGAAVDDIYATVMRQAFFVRFEVDAHRAILDNRPADEIHDLYLENLNEQFGDALDIAPIFRHEWIAIPHLYSTPFYCYAYSFGQLLVMALYRRYQEEGEAFKPVYFRLLGAGGAVRPSELLREAGIDAADPAFWQGGFDLVADWIDRLEAG
jgi:oligoendopeptidase F